MGLALQHTYWYEGPLMALVTVNIDGDVSTVSALDLLYNVSGAFKGRLRAMIPPQVCKAAGKAIENWSRQVFPNIETTAQVKVLEENFLLDYGLVQPQFQNGLANFRSEIILT